MEVFIDTFHDWMQNLVKNRTTNEQQEYDADAEALLHHCSLERLLTSAKR